MNLQTQPILPPLKVLVANPLTPAGNMTMVKILSGKVFGDSQLITLILLVYSNERSAAECLRLEFIGCAFACYNSIIVSTDLPSIHDADVFCFITNFNNPNIIDFENGETEEQFDALYLMLKVANGLSSPVPIQEPVEQCSKKDSKKHKDRSPQKPIIMADGLAAMDILNHFSKDIPSDVFFCPSSISDVTKSVLADYLKVSCNVINEVLVWGANDKVFHVEVEQPIVTNDQVNDTTKCDWDMISEKLLQPFNTDHTQFSPSWLKKELPEKVASITSKNPYGPICKAASISNALKSVWKFRNCEKSQDDNNVYCNFGVISDGSIGTIKGLPYILPLVFCGDSWTVNRQFEESSYVKNEIKRINKEAKAHHARLIPYCKKFLDENVIKQVFIPKELSSTEYSLISSSKHSV